MDNKEFSKVLEKRTLQFAVAVIKMSASLPVIKKESQELLAIFTSIGKSLK